jgi:hypothetical protein
MQNENERLQEEILRILREDSSTTGDYSDEAEMATTELKTIMGDAQAIMDMLSPDAELEAWVQSKITKAADYLNSVRTYMKGSQE